MWRDKSDFSRFTHCVGIYVSIEKLPRPQSKENVHLVVWLIQPHNSKGRLLYFNIGIRQCRQNNLFRMCKSKIYKRLQWNQAFQNNIYSWLEHWTNRNERNKVRKQNNSPPNLKQPDELNLIFFLLSSNNFSSFVIG